MNDKQGWFYLSKLVLAWVEHSMAYFWNGHTYKDTWISPYQPNIQSIVFSMWNAVVNGKYALKV